MIFKEYHGVIHHDRLWCLHRSIVVRVTSAINNYFVTVCEKYFLGFSGIGVHFFIVTGYFVLWFSHSHTLCYTYEKYYLLKYCVMRNLYCVMIEYMNLWLNSLICPKMYILVWLLSELNKYLSFVTYEKRLYLLDTSVSAIIQSWFCDYKEMAHL